MNYAKEKNKVIMLLVTGAVLASGFFYVLYVLRASFSGVLLFVAIMCYPLTISYGKGQIVDIFYSIH